MWQQSKAGNPLILWAGEKFGVRPKSIIPVITNLANLRIDEYARIIYLNPLIEKAKLYSDGFWSNSNWIHISELEKLAALAEEGILDFEKLLSDKNSKYPNMRFDAFLYQYFNKRIILNKLFKTATEFLNDAINTFWPSDKSK